MPSYFLETRYRLYLHRLQRNQQPVQMNVLFLVSHHQRTKVYDKYIYISHFFLTRELTKYQSIESIRCDNKTAKALKCSGINCRNTSKLLHFYFS